MTDLKEFIYSMIEIATVKDKANAGSIVKFLQDNGWFGERPQLVDGKVLLSEQQVAVFSEHLEVFLTEEASNDFLLARFRGQYQITASFWEEFTQKLAVSEDTEFYVLDFLLYRMQKDIPLYDDIEIEEMVHHAAMDMIKAHGDVLTFFLAWLKQRTKTKYFKDYVMEKRYTMDIQNQAYSMDEYLDLMYYLFNEDYIDENQMYHKAAKSRFYTDTWLYLSMHCICSLRQTDLERIPHPTLRYSPEETIQRISDGSFSDKDAVDILTSITVRLQAFQLKPSKEETVAGIGSIKVTFPTSCQTHFGKLFALAEAHRVIEGIPDAPIIKKVSSYQQISKYMGDEIGNLFLFSDFRARSANKSYLQAIFLLTDDVMDTQQAPFKGYMLAAMARSHKGGADSFAPTTIEYLKDMQLGNYDPEFVMRELLERGVLSFIPLMMLNSITGFEEGKLDVQNQTKLLKALNMTPYEVERITAMVMESQRRAKKALKVALSSGVNIMTALQRIATGQAFSKQGECLCLLTACSIGCPFPEKRQCVTKCDYEIGTISSLLLLASETKRVSNLYNTVTNPLEKDKYKHIAMDLIRPQMIEMLICLKENYGEDTYAKFENILKETFSNSSE